MENAEYTSRVQQLKEAILQAKRTNTKAIRRLARELEKLSSGCDPVDRESLGFACYYIAEDYYRRRPDSASFSRYLNKAITLSEECNDLTTLTRAYNLFGIDSYNRGNFLLAYDCFWKAEAHAVSAGGDLRLINMLQYNKAVIQHVMGDEFVAIYRGLSEEVVMDTAKRLGQEVAGLRIPTGPRGEETSFTISQGLCYAMASEGQSVRDFTHQADMGSTPLAYRVYRSLCRYP